jgi:5-methylcytosine-specific restriction endonuclease McrA
MWYKKLRGLRITQLMSRDGSFCHLCGDLLDRKVLDCNHPRYITFDHIIPRAKGGTDTIGNLCLAHKRCNELRGCDPILIDEEESL